MTIRTCEHTSRIVGDAVPIITLVAGTADISDVQITADPCGGYSDTYCLAPEHRILTSDLRWVACGELVEGDELLAFEEYPQKQNRNRRWRWSRVLRSELAEKPCVRVRMDNGDSIICSEDHPWLAVAERMSRPRKWTMARRLSGLRVARVLDTWEPAVSFEAGWLSGMFDGEGCIVLPPSDRLGGGIRLDVSQKEGPVLDRLEHGLETLKLSTSRIRGDGSAISLHVTGGQSEALRALGTLRPMRLLTNLRKSALESRSLRNGLDNPRVVEVDYLGVRPVQSIATSTGTYIGEGYLMHNSDSYDSCDDGTMTPTRYTITSLPAGHTLEIDAHERRVRVLETDSGKEVSGLDPIDTLGVFRWIGSFRGCCVSIEIDPDAGTVNAATTVSVDWHDREL